MSFLPHARVHQVHSFFSLVRKNRFLPYGEGDGYPVSIQLESLTRRPLFFPRIITEALAVGRGEGKRSVLLLNASLNVFDVDLVLDKVFRSRCKSRSVWFLCHRHTFPGWRPSDPPYFVPSKPWSGVGSQHTYGFTKRKTLFIMSTGGQFRYPSSSPDCQCHTCLCSTFSSLTYFAVFSSTLGNTSCTAPCT